MSRVGPRSHASSRGSKLGYYRASLACEFCRKRKIRCLAAANEKETRCANCTRLGRQCVVVTVDKMSCLDDDPPAWNAKVRPVKNNNSSSDLGSSRNCSRSPPSLRRVASLSKRAFDERESTASQASPPPSYNAILRDASTKAPHIPASENPAEELSTPPLGHSFGTSHSTSAHHWSQGPDDPNMVWMFEHSHSQPDMAAPSGPQDGGLFGLVSQASQLNDQSLWMFENGMEEQFWNDQSLNRSSVQYPVGQFGRFDVDNSEFRSCYSFEAQQGLVDWG